MRSQLITILVLLGALPASAETIELKNPSWREVPNTKTDGSAYVEVNSIVKTGNRVIYDLVNSEATYSQVEMDCSSQRFRTIRTGYFETRSRINYKQSNDPWLKPETQYQKALAAFVCGLK